MLFFTIPRWNAEKKTFSKSITSRVLAILRTAADWDYLDLCVISNQSSSTTRKPRWTTFLPSAYVIIYSKNILYVTSLCNWGVFWQNSLPLYEKSYIVLQYIIHSLKFCTFRICELPGHKHPKVVTVSQKYKLESPKRKIMNVWRKIRYHSR